MHVLEDIHIFRVPEVTLTPDYCISETQRTCHGACGWLLSALLSSGQVASVACLHWISHRLIDPTD